ncbi:MAG: DUF6664 family protein [Erysipelotrichaceae bacterium]
MSWLMLDLPSRLEDSFPQIDSDIVTNLRKTSEEHAAFAQCLRLSRKLDKMERLQLYFRGHTDAVTYLKKIKAI